MVGKTISNRLGYQQIEDLSEATRLAAPLKDVNGASARSGFAVIIPEGGDVRWRDDGIDPTITVGMPLAEGGTLIYDGDLSQIRFIRSAGFAKLNITYYA